MPQLFTDTKQMVASYYMTSDMPTRVYEDRQEFIANELDDLFFVEHIFLVYVGEGFCPLTFAVIADNESDAIEAVDEYLRDNGREDEIDEDGEHITAVQEVPADFIRKIAPPQPELPPDAIYRTVRALAGVVVFLRYRDGAYKLTGEVRRDPGYGLEVEVYPFDQKRLYRFYVPAYNIARWPK